MLNLDTIIHQIDKDSDDLRAFAPIVASGAERSARRELIRARVRASAKRRRESR